MTSILRILAWLLAAAVTFATLGPPRYRPHAALITHDGEHALAFVLIGLGFALAYPKQRLWAAGAAVVLTGLLEVLQLFVAGRHATFEDFLVDALAALAGFALVVILSWMTQSYRRADAP